MENTIQNNLKYNLDPVDFHLGPIILSGTFGDVFKGTYKNDPHLYAIKSINIRPNQNSEKVAIQSEIAILDIVSNNYPRPNAFPNFYGHFVDTTRLMMTENYGLIFDFFPSSLRKLIETHKTANQPIDFHKFKGIYNTLLDGLAFLQSRNICHRDLSPNNIMLDTNDTVKIIDYGVSKDITNLQQLNREAFTMTIAGKISYMAPEVLAALIANKNKVFLKK